MSLRVASGGEAVRRGRPDGIHIAGYNLTLLMGRPIVAGIPRQLVARGGEDARVSSNAREGRPRPVAQLAWRHDAVATA